MRHLALAIMLTTWLFAASRRAEAQFTQNAFQLTPPGENLPDRNAFTQWPQETGNRPYPDKVLLFRSDILYWALQENKTPIITSGTTGVLGQSGTRTLLGEDVSLNPYPGFRGVFTLMQPEFEIELGAFILLQQEDVFAVRSIANNPPLFLATLTPTGQESAQALSSAGVTTDLRVATSTQLWGMEVNFFKPLWQWEEKCFGGGVLVGYRYLNLIDQLQMNGTSTQPGVAVVRTSDSFDTTNQFHGFQVGMRGSYKVLPTVCLDGVAKVALGVSAMEADVNGLTTSSTGVSANTGILALASNSGNRTLAQFGVVPQGQIKASWAPLCWLQLSLGCEGLYWSEVARAGEQVDRRRGAPGLPSPDFVTDGFFAYGIFGSIEFVY